MMRQEKTTAQVLVGAGPDGMLPPGVLQLMPASSQGWYRKVRLMRRDSSLGFLRDVYMAPMLSAGWTVTCDDPAYEDAIDDIHDSFVPFRTSILRDALRGTLDFGWQGFEIVKQQHQDGTFYAEKFKGLLQELTSILVDYHGRMVGLRNISLHSLLDPNPVFLFRGDSLVVSRDVEGTNWYGEPLLRRAERPFDSWNECDDGARRFDVKVAGAHWVVYYPVGRTRYNQGATKVDNAIIAQDILAALSSTGKVAIPQVVLKQVDELNTLDASKIGWRIELLSAQTNQSQFVDRLKYIDSLKCRAFGIPERAILEGQFGTKAEAEAHADFAVDNMEMTHKEVVAQINRQAVDVFLELNWGPAYCGHVHIEPASLNDDKRALLKDLYKAFVASDDGKAETLDRIDWKGIEEELGIPVRESRGDDEQEDSEESKVPGHVALPSTQANAKLAPRVRAALSKRNGHKQNGHANRINGYTVGVLG